VRVRRAHPGDAPFSFAWFSDAAVTRYLPLAGQSALPFEAIQSFLAQAASSDRPGVAVTFDLEQGPIGCGSFRNFDAGSAEVSIVIGVPALWQQGLGAEAFKLLLAFGFEELQLKRIWLVVRADNDRALKLFRRFGFEVTEHQLAAVTIDGVAHDKLKMQLWAEAYNVRAGA
jgi:RimJ/RimL family protein N-acetyltransferase